MIKQNLFSANEYKRIFEFFDVVALGFIFLASMNFMNRFVYCVFIAFLALFFCGMKSIKLNTDIVPLLLFSVSLLLFWDDAQISVTSMIKVFSYPLCFIVGYNLPVKDVSAPDREKALRVLTYILAFGALVHLALNMFLNWGQTSGRNTVDFWVGGVVSATGQASLGCMVIGVGVAALMSGTKIWVKVAAALSLITMLFYNLTLAGRTIFVMIGVVVACAFLYYIYRFSFTIKTLKMLFWVGAAVVALILIYNNNLFGIKDAFEESNFYERFFGDYAVEMYDDVRFKNKTFYLKHIFEYPWGGGKIHDLIDGYAHDIYLDTHDEAGIFAMITIIIVIASATVKALRVMRNKNIDFATAQMLFCLFVSFHFEFLIEPILVGMTWLLTCFCAVYGAVSRLDFELKKEDVKTDEDSVAV